MDCVYRNPSEPIEARVRDLVSRMTLKEKIGQMSQIERSVATPSAIRDFSIGTPLSLFHLPTSSSLLLVINDIILSKLPIQSL